MDMLTIKHFLSPSMPTAHYMSGLALLATGKFDEAKPLLGAVVGVNIEGLPLGGVPEGCRKGGRLIK